MNFNEVLRAGQRQHRLDALLHAGQLQMASGAVHLAVEIHQAADRRAVHIGDRRKIDEDVAVPASDERAEHIGVAAGIPIFGLDALTSAAYGPETALALLIPLGAMGSGEDIGAACVYLASREASYVTGQTLHVNGGMAMI